MTERKTGADDRRLHSEHMKNVGGALYGDLRPVAPCQQKPTRRNDKTRYRGKERLFAYTHGMNVTAEKSAMIVKLIKGGFCLGGESMKLEES